MTHIEHVLRDTYGAKKFTPNSDWNTLSVHANHWQCENMAISYCDYGARVEVEFPAAKFHRQQFTLEGSCEISVAGHSRDISRTQHCVVPQGADLLIRFQPDFRQVVLRLEDDYLCKLGSALMGDTIRPVFLPQAHRGGPSTLRLEKLLRGFVAGIGRPGRISPVELAEREQALAIAFLSANPHSHQASMLQSPADIAQRQLIQAEEYIDANWHSPLSIERLCAVTSAPARSIFHHFRKWRGKTPMAYLKEVRLQHARRILLKEPQLSVTEIALACGFGNFGHFASDYRRQWGERPSETRSRGRH